MNFHHHVFLPNTQRYRFWTDSTVGTPVHPSQCSRASANRAAAAADKGAGRGSRAGDAGVSGFRAEATPEARVAGGADAA